MVARLVGDAAADQIAPVAAALDALRSSSVASLRALAMVRYQAADPARAAVVAEAGLFDLSPSVRFLAQRFLAQQGVDLRQRYRGALPDQVVAIQGLAEVGETADAAAIEPYLSDERVRARVFAVHGVGRLLGAESRTHALTMLDDPSPTVVRAAGRVLAQHQLAAATLDELWRRVASSDRDCVRRAVFGVFVEQSRWPRLVLASRAITSDDDELRRRGERLLTSVRSSWNRSYTRPSDAQVAELTALEPRVGDRIPPTVRDELRDLLRRATSGS